MAGNSPGVRLRPARRRDVFAIVMISNSSVDEEEDIGFGTPRSESVFSDARRLSRGYRITGEEENDWTRSIGAGVREIRMEKEIPQTTEIVLRDVAETDLPIFFEHQRDPAANFMAAFTSRDPADRDAFAAHWKRILNDDTVVVKTIVFEGRVIGNVAKFVDREFGKPEVTYWIGKEYWGMGFATKALSRFLRDIQVRPIYGRAAKDNVASIRVMEKCGFAISGYGKGFASARAKEIEEVILELSDPAAS